MKKKHELTPGSKTSEFQSKPKKKALLQSSEVSSSYLLQSSEEIQPNETSEKPSGSGIAPGPSSEEDSTLNSYGPTPDFTSSKQRKLSYSGTAITK